MGVVPGALSPTAKHIDHMKSACLVSVLFEKQLENQIEVNFHFSEGHLCGLCWDYSYSQK